MPIIRADTLASSPRSTCSRSPEGGQQALIDLLSESARSICKGNAGLALRQPAQEPRRDAGRQLRAERKY